MNAPNMYFGGAGAANFRGYSKFETLGPLTSSEIRVNELDEDELYQGFPEGGITIGGKVSVTGQMQITYIDHEYLEQLAAEQRYYLELNGVHLTKRKPKKPLPPRSGSARGNARRIKAKMACRPKRTPYKLRIEDLRREDIWPDGAQS